MRPPLRLGEVVEFDDERGLGAVRDADGGWRFPFHCTEIAGGRRTIAPGARVAFLVARRPGGVLEATSVVDLGRRAEAGDDRRAYAD